MKKLTIALLTAVFLGVASGAGAAAAPDELVRQTTDKVLAELTAKRDALKADQSKLYALVDEIILPHFDFERMSRLVLGKYWRDATPEQQKQFMAEFKSLLVRTYATALFEYTGQKIVYKPFHDAQGDGNAVVKTEVQPSDGPAVPLHYSLAKSSDDGNWRVFDIRIDGISLVTNYRTTYGRTIQRQGMDGLIASLTQKNQELDGR